ncbi:MAG: tetratricopeptide repeat protein [Thermoplasmata archaeon]|nr:tetratricopeptide repeat protein [Thermoplasmata archaeon]
MEDSSLHQPKMVGREEELGLLKSALSKTIDGNGSTVLVSGEAGIGKTRLVSEIVSLAENNGALAIKGWCLPECLEPLMPVKEALRSAGLQDLMADAPPPKVLSFYLLNDAGMLFAKAERIKTDMDADIFAAMLKAVSCFVTDSLRMMGKGDASGLSSISHSGYKILIQSRGKFSLAVVIEGIENEFLIEDMKRLLAEIEPTMNPDTIDTSEYNDVETKLTWLINSAKYDGSYVHDDPRIKQENLFDNVLLGLQRASLNSPIMLFLDDIQWADPSTLGLLHYLSRNTRNSKIMMLATYRPEDVIRSQDGSTHHLETVMQNMSRESLFLEIRLKRLGQEDTESMIQSALGSAELPIDLAARIHKESEGNPFFILEVIRLLAEEKIIIKESGTWHLTTDIDEIHLPSKIFDVIQRRLNRLLKEQFEILECASVVGEKFGSDVVGKSLDVNRITLLKNLSDIEKVHRLIHSLDVKYCFDHSKIREVLYNGISTELKIEYHRMIAESYAELFSGKQMEIAEELAYHFMEARDPRAVPHLIIAGDKAKEKYSNEEAISFYTQAIERMNDVPEPRIFESLGDLYKIVGNCERAIAAYEKALPLSNEPASKAEIYCKMSLTYERHSEYEKGIAAARMGLELLGDEPHPAKSELLGAMTWNYIRQSNYDPGIKLQNESLKNATSVGDMKGIAKSHHLMDSICWFRGNFEEALVHYQKALAILRDAGDEHLKVNTLNNIGVVFMETGRLDEALGYFEEGLAYEQMVGDKHGMACATDNIGNLYHTKGEVEKALGYHLRALHTSSVKDAGSSMS